MPEQPFNPRRVLRIEGRGTRLTRALAVMQKLEFKNQTNRHVYRLAHAIAITELGHPLAAQRHLQEGTD